MEPKGSRKKKVGLALSGGAARGLAHMGVLRVLRKEGIPIDIIAGTSAGAVVGAAYAWSQDTELIARQALDANWRMMAQLIDPAIPRSGFIKGKKILDLISTYIGGKRTIFADLRIPFACIATDIDTGEEIVIDSGPVAEALRASISIPGIFRAVSYKGRYLVDGGLTTPVPVEVVKKMGADFIIAVNVNPDVSVRMSKTSKKRVGAHKEPSLFQVMMQSLYIATYTVARANLRHADFIIEPELENIGGGDFSKAHEIIARGEAAAQKAIGEIKKGLGEG